MKSKSQYLVPSQHSNTTQYSIDHIDMLPAIFRVYQMSGVEAIIFMYIFQTWNSNYWVPVTTTCKELSKHLFCAEISVKRCLKRLIDNCLLIRLRNIGVGAKYGYIPNQGLIEKLIQEYQKAL